MTMEEWLDGWHKSPFSDVNICKRVHTEVCVVFLKDGKWTGVWERMCTDNFTTQRAAQLAAKTLVERNPVPADPMDDVL